MQYALKKGYRIAIISGGVKEIVEYISFANGGHGCVRDVIEQTLRAQNRWMESDACIW